eukprot:758235-Hanusia_phi.AAC.7
MITVRSSETSLCRTCTTMCQRLFCWHTTRCLADWRKFAALKPSLISGVWWEQSVPETRRAYVEGIQLWEDRSVEALESDRSGVATLSISGDDLIARKERLSWERSSGEFRHVQCLWEAENTEECRVVDDATVYIQGDCTKLGLHAMSLGGTGGKPWLLQNCEIRSAGCIPLTVSQSRYASDSSVLSVQG